MTNASIDVSFRHVTKRYGELTAVSDLSLNIPRGSFFALLGPSGCGKTTTLRMIAGFETPSEGDVFIRSDNVTAIPPYKRSFGMVFQNYALFPHMTVAQNVAFGLKMRKVPRAESEQRVREALATVQLGHLAERFPKQLSGGQQQRVALARAIVIKPAVLLLDEPLGALDKQLREDMQVELRQLQKGLGITTVFVTHDQEEALTMADQVAVMRGGMIEQIDSPGEIYERPKTEFVASFLGASNFLTGHVKSTTNGKGAVDINGVIFQVAAEDLPQSGPVRLAVRPEKVRIEPLRGKTIGSNALPAVIRQVVYKGSITHVLMEHAGHPLASLLQNDASRDWAPEPGMEVSCSWSDSSIVPLQAG